MVLILTAGLFGSLCAQRAATIGNESNNFTETAAGAYDSSMSGPWKSNMKHFGWGLLMYIPNRILDVFDLVSIRLGVGGVAGAGLKVTDYFQLSGQYGDYGFIHNGFARQYGGGSKSGFSYGLLCWSRDSYSITDTFGNQQTFELHDPAMALTDFRDDKYKAKYLDPWSIGVNFSWLIDIGIYFHPVAIPDLLLGLLMIDIDNDDL